MAKAVQFSDGLKEALSESELSWLAGDHNLSTGQKLANEKSVELLEAGAHVLKAIVSDEKNFNVSICLAGGGDLVYICNCPSGSKELFCAHLVAAAIAWAQQSWIERACGADAHFDVDPPANGIAIVELRKKLNSMGKGDLVELVLNLADRLPSLVEYLSAPAIDEQALLAELKLKDKIDFLFDTYIPTNDIVNDIDDLGARRIDLDSLEVALEDIFDQSQVRDNYLIRQALVEHCLACLDTVFDAACTAAGEVSVQQLIDRINEWGDQ